MPEESIKQIKMQVIIVSSIDQKKWWKVVFVAIIELSIANAFQLFKLKDPLSKVDHLHFRIELIQQLVESTGFTAQSRRQMRLISGLHKINKRSSGKNCCICSRSKARKTTQYYCEDCDLHMHPDKYFYVYHTASKISKRYKQKNLESP